MIKITCNMCGAEMELKDLRILTFDDLDGDREDLHLCPTCRDQVREHITRTRKMIEEPLPPAEALLEKAEKPRKKRPIDKGKIMALHTAAWPRRKIADETDCTYSYIHKVIIELEDEE